MKRIVLVAVALFSLSGCKLLADLFHSAFRDPSLNFKRVALTEVSLGGLTLDTIWELDNPNSVGVDLATIDYALFVEGRQVVAGTPQRGLHIAPNGQSELHFPAAIKFQDLGQVLEVFLTRDTAAWKVQGNIGVQTIGVLQFPLSKEGRFDVPKLPQVAFGNPRLSNISLAGATVEFPITVTNRNPFPLPISNVTGTLSIANQPVGTLSTGNLGVLAERGSKQLTVPLTVNFISAANAAQALMRGGNAQVQFNAQVQSGAFTLPFHVEQVVNFIR